MTHIRAAPADLLDLFGAVIEAMPDAIVVVNEASTMVLVNAQTERLFGYRRSELIGRASLLRGSRRTSPSRSTPPN